ncbi:182 kDa tankyrase-1-binding protein isoform X1 [Equus asinus]|uniref:182 kDa tankyrase-1-binding protein isoform X1 n=1 Tax=Equus asinus TaxID=9793 RepID=UPI0038F6D8B0
MKVSALREGTAMASPPPQELEEELVSAGSEPGDTRAKPPVKPKPRALPSKPALPAKPSLLVPVGPRPPRGPLAELPSARKMNMLAGPQPYGGSKRPLPFATRPTSEASAGGEVTRETGKEEAGKEEMPPLTPPARCAAPGGVRKAPAPFRPASERFAATTVEEILAKMEQPRKEVPASPDRLWGSRLTFNHDGSSRYGPRTYGVASGPRDEDGGPLSRGWSQEGPTKSPTQCPEEHSKTPKERSPASDRAFNGHLAQPASSEPPTDVAKLWALSSPGPASENGGSASPGLATEVSDPAPGSPHLLSPHESSPRHSQLPETQSPAAAGASPCLPETPASPTAALPDEGSRHPPSPGLPAAGVPEAARTKSPLLEKVSGCHSSEQPPATSPQPLRAEGGLLDLARTLPSEEEVAKSVADLPHVGLAQRRFSEGVLQPPGQEQEKLGGSLAALPQTQGSQSALDRPFGNGTESNWSLSQSFEWTFPTRPSGLGVWRLDSPPPSPITEAAEAAEAAEAGDWAASSREEGVSQQGQGAWSAPEEPGRPGSWVQAGDSGTSPTQEDDGESQPQSPALPLEPLPTTGGPPGPALLQAEERDEDREPLAAQESPLPLATRETALPVLEPVLGQQQPASPDQPCVLFADTPDPEQALPAEEEAVTLVRAETTQPRAEAQDSCGASPEPAGPESSSHWLDDLLASPPPSAGSARRGAGSELQDMQTPSACSEGLLGWAQKDLQSEFGIAADPHPSGFSPSSWSQDTSQDYGLGGVSPRGDPGLGERDWTSKCGQGAGEGSAREWASRCGIGQEEIEISAQDGSGGLTAQDQVIGKLTQLGTQRGREADVQDWEFRMRDSQGTYSSRDVELQDQQFGKKDSLGTYSSRDAELQDQQFRKRDSLGTYSSRDVELQDQEFEKRDSLGTYSSRDAELQDQEFGKRNSLGTYSSRDAELQDQQFRKRDSLGTYSSRDAELQDQEFGKRDSLGTYSSRDAELQDQEFGKRNSLGTYSSQDMSLRDWEFGKRDSLATYSSQDADEHNQELGKKDHLGRYSSQDADKQDQEFGKRDPSLSTYGSRDAEQLDRDFGRSAWMRDYSSSGSPTALGPQDRGFGMRALSAGFSLEEAQQQDEEFEKKIPSGGDSPGKASGDAGQSEERESGDLFSPSTPQSQDGALGQRDRNSWQGSGASQEVGGLQGRQQAGGQSPGDADQEDREVGQRGWASDFSLGVVHQPEVAFSPGQRDWSGDFCLEDTERSHQFGIIGNDRVSGAGLSSSSKMDHFVSPEKTSAGPVDWTDQLGLRNLEVSSCVRSGGSSEAREDAMGRMGWSDNLGLRDVDLASCLETGGSEEPRGIGVGEKEWTSDVGVRGRDLAGAGEVEGHSQARESGVGQTDWSGVEAGEFLKSRERGVGQADWTPGLGLRNTAPGAGCSPRELRAGQADWGSNLGLRNLEMPCDLESRGSWEPRGCGVGQMDWTQDLALRDVELSRALSEAREHGVGEVSQCPELGLRDNGVLSPGLEARDPSEARELGVGETSGPETQGKDNSLPSLETRPEDLRMETGEASRFGASSGGCPARSPPSGSQGLLEEMLAASSSKAEARRESAASGHRDLLEKEGATAGADLGEPLEPSRDPVPSWRPQPDGEASRTDEVDGTWGPAGAGQGKQGPTRPPQDPPPRSPSQDFSFIEDTEILDSAMYRSRANLGRKRGHRAPAIRPGGTLGLSEAADSDARLFQDSTEPRTSRVPSSDEEVVEEPQNRRTRMSLGTKGLKVNLFPGLSPSALKAKLRSRNRSAEEGEPVESRSGQKESAVQRSKSCKVPGLGKPLVLPPKPEKSSGSEGSSPNWLQALKLKKKKV